MDDIKRAMFGDREAQERLTEAGILLPCPFCGNTPIVEENLVFCGFCGMGYEELDAGVSKRFWNTRAPILTPDQIERLEETENENCQSFSKEN